MDNEEIGRELRAREMKENTVVILNAEHQPHIFMTTWVKQITPGLVCFYSGVTRIYFIGRIQPDGTLKDDQGRTIKVFEYLGEI